MCAGGRLGPTCAECPAGMFWADDACTPCEISSKIGWIAGLSCILVLMIASYYTLVPSYQPRAHLRECVGMGMDMTLNFVQNLGILSAIPVPWPEGLKNLFEFSSVFVLNLQNMGLDCAFPGASWQYFAVHPSVHGSDAGLSCSWVSLARASFETTSPVLGALQDRVHYGPVFEVGLHNDVQHGHGAFYVLRPSQWAP